MNRSPRSVFVAGLSAATLLAVATSVAVAKPASVTILTGSPGGTWPAKGAAIAEIFARDGVTANAEVGAALSNIVRLSKGQGQLGMTYSIIPAMAKAGEAPFKEVITTTRGVASLFQSWHHIGVRTGTGVETIADLKGKKYASQAVGNASQVALAHVLRAYGLSEGDLALSRGSQDFGANATKDRNVVGWAALSAVPTGLWAEAFATVDMKLLPLPPDAFAKVKAMNDGWVYSKIPAGTYRGVTEDVPVISSTTVLVTSAEVPEADVYWMTKKMLDNIAEIRAVHAALRDLTPKSMADVAGAEMHPGARRAYREAGLLP